MSAIRYRLSAIVYAIGRSRGFFPLTAHRSPLTLHG
jgi:hypothetical protein